MTRAKSQKKPNQFADVIIAVPIDRPFTYSIPHEFSDLIRQGIRVIVPFGQSYQPGIVLSIHDKQPDESVKLKPIHDIVSDQPFVDSVMQKLLTWISQYYVCYLGEAFRLVHPDSMVEKSALQVRIRSDQQAPGKNDQKILKHLSEDQWLPVTSLAKKLAKKGLMAQITRLVKAGILEKRFAEPRIRSPFKTLETFFVRPLSQWSQKAQEKYQPDGSPRFNSGRKLIAELQTTPGLDRAALTTNGFPANLLRRLQSEQVLEIVAKEVHRNISSDYHEEQKDTKPTDEQRRFIERVKPLLEAKQGHKTFLLHGITGSGKTRIYIELISLALQARKSAIVLIPEIVLTPQTLARFQHYFGEQVAVIHSRLSKAERGEVLHRIRMGDHPVVIGPRSALFAPLSDLGIIIMDEEHESSYKQSDAVPRYHARECAIYRAHLSNIPIVLGSASPSFESMHNARQRKYDYFFLNKRVSKGKLPVTRVIDLTRELRRNNVLPLFSENLLLNMESRIIAREQGMLLLNRRGFSPYIQCKECGLVIKCPNCDITLTYHISGKNLRCHYCDHREDAPDACPSCKGIDILYQGIGTQKIEQEARKLFSNARFLRMDQDTTRRRGEHEKILEKFRSKQAEFLIGTKMIAKGLDFESVTLVGILNADQGMHFPDFRASEKSFQLLMQAAGRAGRGARSGEVLIQTFDPDHYIFQYLVQHNYQEFYKREVQLREKLNYPPFSRICLIRISAETEDRAMTFGNQIAGYLRHGNKTKNFTVLGPAPSPLSRVNNRYRYQIMVKQERQKDRAMTHVRYLLRQGIMLNPEVKKWPVDIQIDMDPIEIL